MTTSNESGFDKFLSAYDAAEQHRAQQKQLEHFLLELLGVADTLHDLERHCGELEGKGVQGLPRSLSILRRRLLAALKGQQVEAMNCKGQPLDLSRHEVIDVRAVQGASDDIVLEERVPGFMRADRVLRHAKVIVSKAQPAAAPLGKRAKRRKRGRGQAQGGTASL